MEERPIGFESFRRRSYQPGPTGSAGPSPCFRSARRAATVEISTTGPEIEAVMDVRSAAVHRMFKDVSPANLGVSGIDYSRPGRSAAFDQDDPGRGVGPDIPKKHSR